MLLSEGRPETCSLFHFFLPFVLSKGIVNRKIKFTIVSRARMRAFHQSIRKPSTYNVRFPCYEHLSGTILVTEVKNCK